MQEKVNTETGSTTDVVEHLITILVVGETHRFSLWVPRYISARLTAQDWAELGIQLREVKDEVLRRMVASGDYFKPDARGVIYEHVEQSMRELTYRRFRRKQAEAGNGSWSVSPTLQGELYKR